MTVHADQPRSDDAGGHTTARDVLLALRPAQWTKNAVVLAAFFFAFWDRSQPVALTDSLKVLLAAAIFSVVSSGVYVFNDVRDREADRWHPLKKRRPIAAGRISLGAAAAMIIALLATGFAGAWLLSPPFATVVAAYVAMQLLYSLGLKRAALVDVLVIAAGFVLRAIAGAVVLDVAISSWLLLCAFLLALFLSLCKRRHEKRLPENVVGQHRPSLDKYDEKVLDQLIPIVSSATIVAYAIYTLSPGTVEKFGSARLGFSIPFVVFGIFRYVDLVYRHDSGDRPERILLTDMPILVNLILYALSIVVIFCLKSP